MPPEAPGGARIVLVEDDDVDAIAVRRGLRKLGNVAHIHRLVDGQSALEYLRESPPAESPMVLLIDINMPRMSGLELLRELRRDRDYDAIDVFILTTSHLAEDVAAAEALKVSGYITKDNADAAFKLVAKALARAAGAHA